MSDTITSFDQLYPGRFVKAGDLGNARPTVEIESVKHEDLEGERGIERKVVVSFVGRQKKLVLAKINGLSLKHMFGPDVTQWIGKRVVLHATADLMPIRRGEACIRVYGSPDIAGDVRVEWKPAQRKKLVWTLYATGTAQASADDDQPFFDDEPGDLGE